jgi:hypothetical protein
MPILIISYPEESVVVNNDGGEPVKIRPCIAYPKYSYFNLERLEM